MLIASKDKSSIKNLKQELNNKFDEKALSATKLILDIEIYRDRKANELYLI